MIRRSPAVAVVAILSLGLGIGGAAAVFGLTDTPPPAASSRASVTS